MDSLDTVDTSLDNLEDILAPLLEKPLSGTLTELDLLQRAKLQVLLPYVVNSLVFIYLRNRGINPKTHSVVGELDRVKQYFSKIKEAEDPEKRRFTVDQGAATRFIKHAIKESQASQEQAQREMKRGTHTRFTTDEVVGPSATPAALAKIQARDAAGLQEESASHGSDLEIFDELNQGSKRKEGDEGVEEAVVGKKRRRGIDPWTGYDVPEVEMSIAAAVVPMPAERRKKAKSGSSSPADVPGDSPGLVTHNFRTRIEARETGRTITQVATASKAQQKPRTGDVDTPLKSPAELSKPSHKQPSQVIDIDAMESSRSTTPAPGKSRGKKKKKKSST